MKYAEGVCHPFLVDGSKIETLDIVDTNISLVCSRERVLVVALTNLIGLQNFKKG